MRLKNKVTLMYKSEEKFEISNKVAVKLIPGLNYNAQITSRDTLVLNPLRRRERAQSYSSTKFFDSP